MRVRPTRQLLDDVSSLILILVGAAVVLFQVGSAVGLFESLSDRWIMTALLTVVSLLAVSIGLERWTTSHRLHARIDSIQASVEKAVGGVFLQGSTVIWSHTLGTITSMKSSLVSVVVGPGPRAPDWWSKGVIDRLSDTALTGNGATWDVYLQAPSEFRLPPTAYARFDAMKSAGVLGQFALWHLPFEEKSGFDFFVVDKEHVYLTIPAKPELETPHRAIFFRDKPELAQQLVDWLATLQTTKLSIRTPSE